MNPKYSEDRNRGRMVDKHWNQIFSDYSVLDYVDRYGVFKITASEINRYHSTHLMTTFNYTTNLPDVFYDNELAILPTKEEEYAIGRFHAYQKLMTTDKTILRNRKTITYPSWVGTAHPQMTATDHDIVQSVQISGMLKDLFQEERMVQTISGKVPSRTFSFDIEQNGYSQPFSLEVDNAVVNIDAGFETPDKLILLEAKNTTTNSFLVQQLYYPYQLWARQLNKEVVPVFLQYANDTYNFSIFRFNRLDHYNSIELLSRHNYMFNDERTTLEDVIRIHKNVSIIVGEDRMTFPQANSLIRVLGVVEAIHNAPETQLTAEQLSLVNDFVVRQADYYARAAIFLGFVEMNPDSSFTLTRLGEDYMRTNRKARNLRIAKQVLQHSVFHHVFQQGIQRNRPLNATETHKYLESNVSDLSQLSLSTRKRRASIISSWVRYLFDMVDA